MGSSTHQVINVEITSYYSCPGAQTRLSLVNYTQIRRELAADWCPALLAEAVILSVLVHNPKDREQRNNRVWLGSCGVPYKCKIFEGAVYYCFIPKIMFIVFTKKNTYLTTLCIKTLQLQITQWKTPLFPISCGYSPVRTS